MEKNMETTIVYWGYIVVIVLLKWIEYGVGYIIIRSRIPHIPSTKGGTIFREGFCWLARWWGEV